MNLRPLTGQVLVEILPENSVTAGGLFIPDTAKVKDDMGKLPPLKARVIRLGRWPQKKNGLCALPEFSPGDTVLVSQYSGEKVKSLGQMFRLVGLDDVLAKLS
jgi:chaperonin GroES